MLVPVAVARQAGPGRPRQRRVGGAGAPAAAGRGHRPGADHHPAVAGRFGGRPQARPRPPAVAGVHGVDALEGAVSEPAWQTKPSWYLVATDDRTIPPPAQRAMSERAASTVTETPGSHAVYVSRPAVVAAVIAQAAQGLNGQV
ncbi:alpha/beta fold hydrolase [Streptomyces sp. NPDC056835]|uniref:alpha/beta fold hydrolase n=1 Tax=Streptomyces sp. NPDC056835 TaxID=3345956 RepID=UPI00368D4BEB